MCESIRTDSSRGELALALWEVGAILDKSRAGEVPNGVKGKGFKLKLHEENPDAPLSPIYLNLRTPENPKPGPLNDEVLKKVIWAMLGLFNGEYWPNFHYLVGVPHAGTPFAMDLVHTLVNFRHLDRWPTILRMQKEERPDGTRRIGRILGDFRGGQTVLLVDDLITKADSKLEAISRIRSAGLVTSHLVVLVDREEGGAEELKKVGVELRAVFTLRELLRFYRGRELLAEENCQEILEYLAK